MTSIEWCDRVWNPIVGCSRVSAGCENCYAERVAHRGMSPQHRGLTVMGKHGPRWTGEVRFLPERLEEPLRWRKPSRVFVNSMSDLFHESVTDEQIASVFAVMSAASRHTFQVLTKRPERARDWFRRMESAALPERLCIGAARAHGIEIGWPPVENLRVREPRWPLPNVWLGVSAEDQKTADERIPLLLECPAALRWVSYEPALGPVDFDEWLFETNIVPVRTRGGFNFDWDKKTVRPALDWIVVGGESGPGARPFDLAWARSTIAQCRDARVACFAKQIGSGMRLHTHTHGRGAHIRDTDRDAYVIVRDRKGGDPSEWPEDLRVREWPEVSE